MEAKDLERLIQQSVAAAQVIQQSVAAVLTPEVLEVMALVAQVSAAIRRQLVEHLEALREHNIAERTYFRVMLELDWPPPLGLTYSEMSEIAVLIEGVEFGTGLDEDVARQIENIVLAAHGDDTLSEYVERWCGHSILNDSEKAILRDAIAAHGEQKFSLVVPTMMARVEGLIAKGFRHVGQMGGQQLTQYTKRLFSGQAYACDEQIREFLKRSYLGRFKHGQPVTATLSRHAVLHGGDSEYATEANSLRSIILYDFVLSVFTYVGELHARTLTLHLFNACEEARILAASERACFFPDAISVGKFHVSEKLAVQACPHCFDEKVESVREDQSSARRTPGAKLTPEEVLQIRSLWAGGGRQVRELAKLYEVSDATIRRLLRGKTWSHVGGPVFDTLRKS